MKASLLSHSAVVEGALTQGKGGKGREKRRKSGKRAKRGMRDGREKVRKKRKGGKKRKKTGRRQAGAKSPQSCASPGHGRKHRAPRKPPLPPALANSPFPYPFPRAGGRRRLTDVTLHGDLLDAAVGPVALGRGGHGGLRGRLRGHETWPEGARDAA